MVIEEIVVRIAIAVMTGGAIGYEREYKNRPAGFRTHILVCVGACVIALIQVTMNEEIIHRVLQNPNLENVLRADYGRLSAQVVSGVGFLGAGTIIHNKGSIKGLTTAATLWLVACLGLAVGYGYYFIGITALVISVLVLISLKRIQGKLFYSAQNIRLEVIMKNATKTMHDVENFFDRRNVHMEDLVITTLVNREKSCIYTLNLPRAMTIFEVMKELAQYENILEIKRLEEDH